MFPLGGTLVPHEILPLHVFEPRYRALVHDCLATGSGFGVVLIERGSEVGGGDVRFDIGCLASIVSAEELADGRWHLVTAGVQPLRVVEWLPDDPYPLAEIDLIEERWDDEATALLAAAVERLRTVVDLATRLGGRIDPGLLELPGDPELDHWALIARAPVGPLDKHALLAAEGPAARLRVLDEQLSELAAVLASRLGGG